MARQLEAVSAVRVVATATTGAEVLCLTEDHRPDVVLLDLGVTSPSGLEVIEALNARGAAPAVVALSEHVDRSHLLAAHYAGVAAYVPKVANLSQLLTTISRVAAQPARLSLEQVHALHRRYGNSVKRLPEVPTHRLAERHEILLALLVEGHSNRTIASRLGVREKTVRNELTRLYHKLGVRSRTEAALVAVKRGLLTREPR